MPQSAYRKELRDGGVEHGGAGLKSENRRHLGSPQRVDCIKYLDGIGDAIYLILSVCDERLHLDRASNHSALIENHQK